MNRTIRSRHCCILLTPVLAVAAVSYAKPGAPQNRLPVTVVAVDHLGVQTAAGTDPGTIGNVRMTLPDGSHKLLTTSGLACDVKSTANGTIIGWTEGQILKYPDRNQPVTKDGYPTVPTFFPKSIVVRRNNKQRQLVPEKLYLVVWKFLRNGRQIGVRSEGSHGPTYLQLFDTSTGKLLDHRMDFEKKLPAWTREL